MTALSPAALGRLADLLAGAGAGADLSAFDWYLAMAYYKLAVIAQGITYRHALGVTVGEGYEQVGASVPLLLEAGLAVGARE